MSSKKKTTPGVDVDLVELVRQAAQSAQQATQAASQVAQSIDQLSAKYTQQASQTTGSAQSTSRNEDIGGGENIEAALIGKTNTDYSNMKHILDSHVRIGLSGLEQLQKDLAAISAINIRVLSDAATNADNLQKQHLAHRDITVKSTWDSLGIASDRIWNVDEQSWVVNQIVRSQVFADALAAAVASTAQKTKG